MKGRGQYICGISIIYTWGRLLSESCCNHYIIRGGGGGGGGTGQLMSHMGFVRVAVFSVNASIFYHVLHSCISPPSIAPVIGFCKR